MVTPRALSTNTRTAEARELLERWSREKLFNPDGALYACESAAIPAPSDLEPSEHLPGAAASQVAESADAMPAEEIRREPSIRVHPQDLQEQPEQRSSAGVDDRPASSESPAPPAAPSTTTTAAAATAHTEVRRFDQPQATVRAPHFPLHPAIETSDGERTNWVSFWAQLLAYGGVLTLTVGTCLVVWGFFGGPTAYKATGWLVAAAGQMLLFLGVVTLVSGGMEQTADDLATRMQGLGRQLSTLERNVAELRSRLEAESQPAESSRRAA